MCEDTPTPPMGHLIPESMGYQKPYPSPYSKHVSNAKSIDLQERLRYYRDNKHTFIHHHDQNAADHSDEMIAAMGRLTRRRWVRHIDKLSVQFQKESGNREAGQLSLPRMLGVESPLRPVTKRTQRTETPTRRKIQTTLRFIPPTDNDKIFLQSGTNTSMHGNRMWRPPVQRCAGVSFKEDGTNICGNRMRRPPVQQCAGVSFITERERVHSNDHLSAIRPAATVCDTRHSGEHILVVDTNT